MHKTILKTALLLTLFTSGVASVAINSNQITTTAQAKQKSLPNGIFRTKKPIKVSYIKMSIHPWKDHAIAHAVIPKGTKVHAFYKYTEGCRWVVFGGNVKITKNVWPSATLTHKNVKLLHKQDVYGKLPKSFTD